MSLLEDSLSSQERKYDDEPDMHNHPNKTVNLAQNTIVIPSSEKSAQPNTQNLNEQLQSTDNKQQASPQAETSTKNDSKAAKSSSGTEPAKNQKQLSYAQTVANGLDKNDQIQNIRTAPGGVAFDVDCTAKNAGSPSKVAHEQSIKHILHQHELEHHLQKFLRNKKSTSELTDSSGQPLLPGHGYSLADLSSLMQLLQCNRGHYCSMLSLRRKRLSQHHDSQETDEAAGEIDGFLEEFFYNQQRISQLLRDASSKTHAQAPQVKAKGSKLSDSERYFEYSDLIDKFPSLLNQPLPPHVEHDPNDPVSSILLKERYDPELQDLTDDKQPQATDDSDKQQSDDQRQNHHEHHNQNHHRQPHYGASYGPHHHYHGYNNFQQHHARHNGGSRRPFFSQPRDWAAYGHPGFWYMQQNQSYLPMNGIVDPYYQLDPNMQFDDNNYPVVYDEWGNAIPRSYCGSASRAESSNNLGWRRGSHPRLPTSRNNQPSSPHDASVPDETLSSTSSNQGCILLSTAEYNRLLALANQNHPDQDVLASVHQPSPQHMKRRSSTGSFPAFVQDPDSNHSQRRGSIGADGLTRKERRRMWYAKYLQTSRRDSSQYE